MLGMYFVFFAYNKLTGFTFYITYIIISYSEPKTILLLSRCCNNNMSYRIPFENLLNGARIGLKNPARVTIPSDFNKICFVLACMGIHIIFYGRNVKCSFVLTTHYLHILYYYIPSFI